MSEASRPTSVLHGANYHGLYAKTTRKVLTQAPIYRVECTCGWESGWSQSWLKSLDGHIYREQRRAAA